MACTAYEDVSLLTGGSAYEPVTVPTHTPDRVLALQSLDVDKPAVTVAYVCTRCHLLYVEEPK